MRIEPVTNVLKDAGFSAPNLHVLLPNEDDYRAMLIQPQGVIEFSSTSVRSRDRDGSKAKFMSFLSDAKNLDVDLVVAPEYSIPWDTLVDSINNNVVPKLGQLWVLGCESIRYDDLSTIKRRLGFKAELLHEPLQQQDQRFVDPLAYVFVAPRIAPGAPPQVVVLVQFKTSRMGGDSEHFETTWLQIGEVVYQFGIESRIRLLSLICSDVFDFSETLASDHYQHSLIIHVQLNPNPRQLQFRRYRESLFALSGDSTEVICLNWAKNVEQWNETTTALECWQNIAGSAWYLRPDKFDFTDQTLVSNHSLGLYYTYLKDSHTNALLFNYLPCVFYLTASKVAHVGITASKSYRVGPRLRSTRVWDSVNNRWVEQPTADDGFSGVVPESDDAQSDLKIIAESNPIAVERILSLSTGSNLDRANDEWFQVLNLDSCQIHSDEFVRRMTFCQDSEPSTQDFRISRLKRCGRLCSILSAQKLPALADIHDGYRLDWSANSPHQNVISSRGKRATSVYLGEDVSEEKVNKIFTILSTLLNRCFAGNENESRAAQQRLTVWYQKNGNPIPRINEEQLRFDRSGEVPGLDITRIQ